ncbi:hypothetical protein ACFL10_02375, partial [Patescibacteria group bacterium]
MNPPEKKVPEVQKKLRKHKVNFESGKHAVADKRKFKKKFSKDYVNLITGSTDPQPFSHKIASPAFYSKVVSTAKLLLKLYKKRPSLFTKDTRTMLASPRILKLIASKKPRNSKQLANLDPRIKSSSIYGPRGALNVLLSFLRAISIFKKSTLMKLIATNKDGSFKTKVPLIKISLKNNIERSVELVSAYEPEVKKPDISKIKLSFDYPVQ